MKLRWSNGYSTAYEFEAPKPDEFASGLESAMIEYRRRYGGNRDTLQLHVQIQPERWTDPALSWTDPVSGENRGGYVHVVHRPGVVDPPDGRPKVRGTDYVLMIGPGSWHEDLVYDGCVQAMRYVSRLTGFVADIVDGISSEGTLEP